jgi:hypothetical protein
LLGVVVVGFLPTSMFLYWLTRLRSGRGGPWELERERDVVGFFGQRPSQQWSMWAFFWSVVFATLVVTVGFLLAYPATIGFLIELRYDEGGLTAAGPADQAWAGPNGLGPLCRPLFFGFLGAYLFTLFTITRRFSAGDLTPDAYMQVASRTILAVIVAAVVKMVFSLQGGAGKEADSAGHSVLYAFTFLVGIFPENGLSWLLSFLRRYLPRGAGEIDSSYELQKLAGLNRWHSIRLNVEGIDNVYNLANVDIHDLVQRTKFSVQQLFDWVDQALLLIHLKSYEEFAKVQQLACGVTSTFSPCTATAARATRSPRP